MRDLYNASCGYDPTDTHRTTGMVTNLHRVGIPNCRIWVGMFHPNDGRPPKPVRVGNIDEQLCTVLKGKP